MNSTLFLPLLLLPLMNSAAAQGAWTQLTTVDSTMPAPWENDLVVDPTANATFFGFGHHNANTNRLFRYTDTVGSFEAINATYHRPPKRCGATLTYDSNLGLIYGWGGQQHWLHWNQGYGTLNETATGLRPGTEVSQEVWAFDAHSEQWYNMRPTGKRPAMRTWPGRVGYDHTATFAADYGLMMVLFHDFVGDGFWAYHGYSNRWIHFPGDLAYSRYSSRCGTDFPCTRSNSPITYDLHSQRLIKVGGRKECFAVGFDEVEDSETWTFEIGSGTWNHLTLAPALPVGLTGAVNSVTTMAATYDQANDLIVVVSSDGKFTSTLDLEHDTGWTTQQLSPSPTAGGIMGNHFKYDAANQRNLIYTGFDLVRNDFAKELWSYDAGPGVPGRPHSVIDCVAETRMVGGVPSLRLSWSPSSTGVPPTSYEIYRAEWDTLPHPYLLLSSTTQTSFIDTIPSAQRRYSYVVRAVVASEMSNPSGAVYDYLQRPMGLVAQVANSQKVELAWEGLDAPDVMGYELYRSDAGAPPMQDLAGHASGFDASTFVKINSSLISNPRYTDTQVDLSDGIIRTYAVVAVNRIGKRSGYSPLAHSIPDQVGGPWAEATTQSIHFLPPPNGRIIGYRVYGDGFGSSDLGLIPSPLRSGLLTTTSFNIPPGQCAAFSIAAVNVLGQAGFHSDIVPIDFGHPGYCPSEEYYDLDGRTAVTTRDPFWDTIGQ